MKNLKTIITLLIGAVIGFSFCQLFHRSCPDALTAITTSDTKASALEQKVTALETSFQQKEDSLIEKNKTLNSVLKETKTVLDKTKKKNIQLQTQVYDLIDRQGDYKEQEDTLSYITGCDSLQTKVEQLILSFNEQDSLHTVTIENLSEQIQNKDSTLLLKEAAYSSLKSEFDKSIATQKLLEQQNKIYKKKYKRLRFGSKLKSIGLLLISGIAAKQLIH